VNAEGYEYVMNLAIASTALAALGPGRYSVDSALGLDRRISGVQAAALAAGLGLAGAAAQLAMYWRKPVPSPSEEDASQDEAAK
jgi:putative oxidoreductase